MLIRSVSESPEIDSPKFVADEPPSRQKGGDTIAARRNPRRCSCGFPLLEHARKTGVNKYQKRKGGWIMKAKSFLLNVVGVATGLTFLSLPAGAECWMTCPPGSTTTQSAAGTQGVTATVEPTASPGLTTAKKPEATAKASPTPVPKATLAPDRAGPATEPPPIPPAAPAPVRAPTKGQATPPVPVPQSSETNAAFQPAPSQAAPPAPVPIPGPVPGTATMHVITE